jgi:hypothetical protein
MYVPMSQPFIPDTIQLFHLRDTIAEQQTLPLTPLSCPTLYSEFTSLFVDASIGLPLGV